MFAEHRTFDDELKELNKMILEMGGLVESSIRKSIESLKKKDEEMAKDVIRNDDPINKLEVEIDEKCVSLLALRQPMAVDLRFITTGMRITTDLERIGDLSVDIAERSLEMMSQPLPKPLIDIPKLGDVASRMLKGALDSFVKRDINIARDVWKADDEADNLRDLIQDELMEVMMKDSKVIPQSVLLIFIARHLERICDHATNIAEDVVYMVEAKMIKHNIDELRKFVGKDWKEKKKF
jgi:phosphate transport system protein